MKILQLCKHIGMESYNIRIPIFSHSLSHPLLFTGYKIGNTEKKVTNKSTDSVLSQELRPASILTWFNCGELFSKDTFLFLVKDSQVHQTCKSCRRTLFAQRQLGDVLSNPLFQFLGMVKFLAVLRQDVVKKSFIQICSCWRIVCYLYMMYEIFDQY